MGINIFNMIQLVLMWITFILLALIEKCSKSCCNCWISCCCASPMYEETIVDPDHMFKLVQWPMQDPIDNEEEAVEMIVVQSENENV